MGGRWSNYSDQDENLLSFRACMKLAQDAALSKMWINIGKQWYTPEEFRVLARNSVKVNSAYDKTTIEKNTVHIKNPINIIPRMELKIKEMQEKKYEFEQRVKQYYENH